MKLSNFVRDVKMVNLVSGPRGSGKTTYISRFMSLMTSRNRSIGGVISRAVIVGGQRAGYDLFDLRTHELRPLARLKTSKDAAVTMGPYEFDTDAIQIGNTAIVAAVRDGVDVVAIDEVGPLEFRSQGWAPSLRIALDECAETQELIVAIRPSLLGELPRQIPSPLWESANIISPPWPMLNDA